MLWLLLILTLICLLYTLSTCCAPDATKLEALRGTSYAHRGLHGPGRPENSMAAFRAAVKAGFGIELDVHLLSDGNLGIMHDSLLRRTAGAEGRIEDLTADDLGNYYLDGTLETVPTLAHVLGAVDGRVPLIIELKAVGDNYAALCEAVCTALDGYRGAYCLESFDPRCVHWLRKHRPDIIRGQLAENFVKSGVNMPWYLRLALTHQMLNFITRPHFTAYKYADRRTLSCLLVRRLWGVPGVSWTVVTAREHARAVSEGWLPVFEGFEPEK